MNLRNKNYQKFKDLAQKFKNRRRMEIIVLLKNRSATSAVIAQNNLCDLLPSGWLDCQQAVECQQSILLVAVATFSSRSSSATRVEVSSDPFFSSLSYIITKCSALITSSKTHARFFNFRLKMLTGKIAKMTILPTQKCIAKR